jgi:hypothetical protein
VQTAAWTDEYLPEAQSVQAPDAVAPLPLKYLPEAQSVHPVELEMATNEPLRHGAHATAPLSAWKKPAAQVAQADTPDTAV